MLQIISLSAKQLNQQKFVSLIYAEYLAKKEMLTWSGAGHEHLSLCKKNGVELIKAGGIVLGVFDDIDHIITQDSVKLAKGDRIVLYTDGATEAKNKENEMFTLERLVDVVKQHKDLAIEEFIVSIKNDIKQFIDDAPQYDDITLVVLEKT